MNLTFFQVFLITIFLSNYEALGAHMRKTREAHENNGVQGLTDCGDQRTPFGKLTSFYLTGGCKNAPCTFNQKANITGIFSIIFDDDHEQLQVSVTLKIILFGTMPIKTKVVSLDGCDILKEAKCPIKKGKEYIFEMNYEAGKRKFESPVNEGEMQVLIEEPTENKSSKENESMCIGVKFNLVSDEPSEDY